MTLILFQYLLRLRFLALEIGRFEEEPGIKKTSPTEVHPILSHFYWIAIRTFPQA